MIVCTCRAWVRASRCGTVPLPRATVSIMYVFGLGKSFIRKLPTEEAATKGKYHTWSVICAGVGQTVMNLCMIADRDSACARTQCTYVRVRRIDTMCGSDRVGPGRTSILPTACCARRAQAPSSAPESQPR